MFEIITGFLDRNGYLGILFLMFAENIFPPIPSELIMPLAGFSAARGEMNLVLAILAGTVGSVLGALFWYHVGVRVGTERLKRWAGRHGRWLTLSPREVEKADAWFDRYGHIAVFLGRMIPAVRTLISVPAGLSEMSMRRFLVYTSLGSLVWTALLASAGYALGDSHATVGQVLNPISNVIIAIIVLIYLYRVVTFRRIPGNDRPR